jgi:regulator of protease activity HflC (stomatin/prohibitin superfamily)
MAEIRNYLVARHVRSEPTSHTLHYRRGTPVRSGRGLSFWFRPLSSSIAEVPLDDRDLDVRFQGRSADFQDVTVQGVITFRVHDPGALAEHVDFSVDLDTGAWRRAPIEKLQSMVGQLAQQAVGEYLSSTELVQLLADGVEETRRRIAEAFTAEPQLAELGLEIVAVRVSALRPNADTEKALELPTRERIQQEADQATFERRALAVEKERAIQENELQNRIEIARRAEQLVAQEGTNRRREAEELAAAERVAADAAAEQLRIGAAAEADRIGLVERASVEAEQRRAEVLAGLSPVATIALVARDTAGLLPDVGQLVVTPDLLSAIVGRLAAPATNGSEAGVGD